jgi:stress-induced morphogen
MQNTHKIKTEINSHNLNVLDGMVEMNKNMNRENVNIQVTIHSTWIKDASKINRHRTEIRIESTF